MTQDRNAVTAITRLRRLFDRPGRTLGAAVVVSLAAHLILAALPAPPLAAPEAPVLLSATITEMPPPPAPPAKPPAPHKRKPKPAPPVVAAPTTEPEAAAATATSEPESATQAEAAAPEGGAPPSPVEETAPVVAETTPAPPELPPRIELVYRGFLGTRGFFIGDAVYRLEHSGSRYSITTVAQARGLAALFIRGEGRLASVGTITRTGLQPDQYSAERTSDGRHEVATFDWESGIVLLNDNKTAALALPTFDPLAVLWQFYFMPPEEDETQFNVATTRRVYHAHFRRVGTETLTLPFRDVETEVWERDGGDGNLTARVWLAPSLHHVMVKMRLSNGRITGEALLDSIRVDENVAQQ
jgi:Protein of unknown function (DUF3108)